MSAGHAGSWLPETKEPVDSPIGAAAQVLDLVHLSRQTFGDADLERDVLRLFLDQAATTALALQATCDASERGRLYHLVKGSARGVGAFALAQVAERGEKNPALEGQLGESLAAITRVLQVVRQLLAA